MDDIIPALERLAARLRRLREIYSAQLTPQSKRFAASLSLQAVIYFIDETLPDGVHLRSALADLLYALVDIEHGRSVDWLSNPPGHRPKGTPVVVGMLRGRYAGCVELLYRQGKQLRDACREVFREIPPDHPVFVGVSNPSWETIKRWRDACIGAVEDSSEKAGYDAMLALAERRPDIPRHMRLVLKNLGKGGSSADLGSAT